MKVNRIIQENGDSELNRSARVVISKSEEFDQVPVILHQLNGTFGMDAQAVQPDHYRESEA